MNISELMDFIQLIIKTQHFLDRYDETIKDSEYFGDLDNLKIELLNLKYYASKFLICELQKSQEENVIKRINKLITQGINNEQK